VQSVAIVDLTPGDRLNRCTNGGIIPHAVNTVTSLGGMEERIMPIPDNDRLVLVFGPSGVGKSTAIKCARDLLQSVVFESLDQLARDLGRERGIIQQGQGVRDLLHILGADDFLGMGIDSLNQLLTNNPEQAAVIDVGAGFLDASKVGNWLATHMSVVLFASPEVAYERIRTARGDGRTFQQYSSQEFASARRRLYNQAQFSINAECESPEQLCQRFVRLLTGLIPESCIGGIANFPRPPSANCAAR
jgi:shikimate kinase